MPLVPTIAQNAIWQPPEDGHEPFIQLWGFFLFAKRAMWLQKQEGADSTPTYECVPQRERESTNIVFSHMTEKCTFPFRSHSGCVGSVDFLAQLYVLENYPTPKKKQNQHGLCFHKPRAACGGGLMLMTQWNCCFTWLLLVKHPQCPPTSNVLPVNVSLSLFLCEMLKRVIGCWYTCMGGPPQ